MSTRIPAGGSGPFPATSARGLFAALASSWLAACGASSDVVVDETDYIVVGVEPRVAIDEATRVLTAHGFAVSQRIDVERFSAASFVDRASGRSAIRVATRRGTALALDARADEGALLSLDARTGQDVTGDAGADVVVLRAEPERDCLALAEVDEEGVLRPVPTELRWIDPSLCLNELVDLDHDRRLDGVVRLPLPGLGDPTPEVALPLLLDDRPAFAPGAWPEGHAQSEISRREAALEVALDRGDASLAVRVSIELAAMVALRGGSDAQIDARLSAARALPLSSEASTRLAGARTVALALRERARPPATDEDDENDEDHAAATSPSADDP